MAIILFRHSYDEIISIENLLEAWQEFVKGKRQREDVLEYERQLTSNLFHLHGKLADMSYRHSAYEAFVISDPKTRSIHKASVADRVLHRAVYRKLYPFFDRTFIFDSYSCRIGKGVHKALDRFKILAGRASNNHRKTAWVLKCDIRKFFASVDQTILMRIIDGRIADKRIVWLIERIVQSFPPNAAGVGLPLGNLTSQLLANIYLNELDQFVKQRARAKYYVRYADDFVIFSGDKIYLARLLPEVDKFLSEELRLHLHPDKIELRTVHSGVDFLGWAHFPDHRILRTATKRRMIKAMTNGASEESVASYRGLLKHGNTFKLGELISTEPTHGVSPHD